MSKGATSRNKARRKSLKSAKKAAMRAKYKAWADDGVTKNSRRSAERKKRKIVLTSRHTTSMCGNVGCFKCFPDLAAKHNR